MTDKLITCRVSKPKAQVRLVCFPWAGSGSSVFNPLAKFLSETVELLAVTPPGRETRYKEPCCFSAESLATTIAETISKKYADKPLFFLGHSFGAGLCQEVAAALRETYGIEVARLYVSGISPPHSDVGKRAKKNYEAMSEDEFSAEIKQLGVLPLNIMGNPEFMRIYLPPLRADLTVIDQIIHDLPQRLLKTPLNCPLTVLEAIEDQTFDSQAWQKLTQGPFAVRQFVGSHFWLKDPMNQPLVCDIINADAAALVTSE